MSTLAVGEPFPALVSTPIGDPASPGPTKLTGECQIVVAFSPSCPYCRAAADREAAQGRLTPLSVTWVTGENNHGSAQFAGTVARTSRVRYAVDMVTTLEIQAVPASFLITPDGEIAKRWVYQGDEDHSPLLAQCSA